MVRLDDVVVTDTLGEVFPLTSCTLLCARSGPGDYSDPIAVLYPDGETVVFEDDLNLSHRSGGALTLDDVDLDET